jgi:elongation factor G
MNGTTPQAPTVNGTTSIRNVVLVGPSGSGKSRLFDHVVDAVVPGRAPRGQTEPTTGLRAATVSTGSVVVTLLDAPGNPDFVGDVRAGLRAADAALFVVSAADGADAQSRALWHECEIVGMPRAVVITQLDARDADFAATLADCQAHFGAGIQPLGVPVPGSEGAVTSIADLLLGEVHDYSGGARTVRPAGPQHAEVFDAYRPALIEGIIEESEDGALMDRYLEGEELDFETLEKDLLTAVAHGSFHPVLPISAETGAGVGVLLHVIEAAFPHPGLHPLPTVTPVGGGTEVEVSPDPDGPLVAEVVHTQSDAYVGHLSLVRVFSGTLRPDRAVHVSGHLELLGVPTGEGHAAHDDDVRPGAIAASFDGELLPKTEAIAGEVVVVTKLATAQTSDTISSPEAPLLVTPWALPEALLPAAVAAATRADEDRMPVAFRELAAEDPSLRIEHDAQTGQVVLWTTGPAHLDLVLSRLRSRFNVGVEQVPVKVAMKETAIARAEAQGRHVKQSGGHGQFAVCHLVMEPLPRGTGIEFDEVVVGGAVPRQFFSSVEKGVHHQLEKGGRRRQGHPHRRQGALGRLLRRRVPDGRRPGPARARLTVDDVPARADRHGDGHRRRRLPRRGDDRHRHAARADHRVLRGRGPARPLGARGRGAAARAARLRDQPALAGARHRLVPPRAPRLRAAARPPGQGPRGRSRPAPLSRSHRLLLTSAEWHTEGGSWALARPDVGYGAVGAPISPPTRR